MNWIFLSFLSAFGQAFGWALKKKLLENAGINNTLGGVSFFTAGVLLFLLWGVFNHWAVPSLSIRFWTASAVVIFTNIIALWTAYHALDRAPLSLLMPFTAVTTLAIIPIEYILSYTLPNALQVFGIILIILGALVLSVTRQPSKKIYSALGYFSVALLCYSLSPPFMAVSVKEVGNGLFAAAIFHFGIALGFLPLAFFAREYATIRHLHKDGRWIRILFLMIATGFAIALLENGPSTVALENAEASEVFALKRVMPFFALIFGIILFQEKITRKHIFGTTLLVFGSILVIWFR